MAQVKHNPQTCWELLKSLLIQIGNPPGESERPDDYGELRKLFDTNKKPGDKVNVTLAKDAFDYLLSPPKKKRPPLYNLTNLKRFDRAIESCFQQRHLDRVAKYACVSPLTYALLGAQPDPDGYLIDFDDDASVSQLPADDSRQVHYKIPIKRLHDIDASVVRIDYPPGNPEQPDLPGPTWDHAGEELLLALRGSVEVFFSVSGHRVTLKPGDFLHYRAEQPHAVYNRQAVPAQVLSLRFYEFGHTGHAVHKVLIDAVEPFVGTTGPRNEEPATLLAQVQAKLGDDIDQSTQKLIDGLRVAMIRGLVRDLNLNLLTQLLNDEQRQYLEPLTMALEESSKFTPKKADELVDKLEEQMRKQGVNLTASLVSKLRNAVKPPPKSIPPIIRENLERWRRELSWPSEYSQKSTGHDLVKDRAGFGRMISQVLRHRGKTENNLQAFLTDKNNAHLPLPKSANKLTWGTEKDVSADMFEGLALPEACDTEPMLFANFLHPCCRRFIAVRTNAIVEEDAPGGAGDRVDLQDDVDLHEIPPEWVVDGEDDSVTYWVPRRRLNASDVSIVLARLKGSDAEPAATTRNNSHPGSELVILLAGQVRLDYLGEMHDGQIQYKPEQSIELTTPLSQVAHFRAGEMHRVVNLDKTQEAVFLAVRFFDATPRKD